MADQLVTPQEIATFLNIVYADLSPLGQANLSLLDDMATGKIQSAAGQLLIDLTTTAVIDVPLWSYDYWLPLPQRPVRSVATVVLDEVAITDYVVRDQMLWRLLGWSSTVSRPSQVAVTYTHGFPTGARGLQLARDMTFGLVAAAVDNPGGAISSESIDDYRVTYAQAEAAMQVTPGMRDMLRDEYGTSAYITSSRD